MKTPRLRSAFEIPRRSFLKLTAATMSTFAALRVPAQSAEHKPPTGDGKLRIRAAVVQLPNGYVVGWRAELSKETGNE